MDNRDLFEMGQPSGFKIKKGKEELSLFTNEKRSIYLFNLQYFDFFYRADIAVNKEIGGCVCRKTPVFL